MRTLMALAIFGVLVSAAMAQRPQTQPANPCPVKPKPSAVRKKSQHTPNPCPVLPLPEQSAQPIVRVHPPDVTQLTCPPGFRCTRASSGYHVFGGQLAAGGGGTGGITVNGVAPTTYPVNFNDSIPPPQLYGLNVMWQLGQGNQISAMIRGDGNPAHCLLGNGQWAPCGGGGTGTITGATANGGLVQTGTTLGMPQNCASTQYMSWSGTSWVCTTPTGGSGGGLPTTSNILAGNGLGGATDTGVKGASGFVQAQVLTASGALNASPFTAPNASLEWFPTGGYGLTNNYGVTFLFAHGSGTSSAQNGGVALAGDNTSGGTSYQVYLNCEMSGCNFLVPPLYNGNPIGGGGGSMTWPTGAAGIANYNGANGWSTSYNATNLIPANFIPTLNQNTTGTAAAAGGITTNGSPNQVWSMISGVTQGWASPASGMIWPTGAAGIPNYGGSSSWGTTYNATSQIPANFIPTLNQSTTGNAATATALFTTPNLCPTGQLAQGILANGNATGCLAPVTSGTVNQFAIYNAATTVASSAHLDDGLTTSGTITSTEPVAAPQINLTGTGGPAITAAGGTLPVLSSGTGGIGIGPGSIPLINSNGAGWHTIAEVAVNGTNLNGNLTNFNASTPAVPTNGAPITFASDGTSNISAALIGNGNASNCLLGTGAFGACPSAGGMVWPSAAGIAVYSGSSSWSPVYNTSNPIPNSFLPATLSAPTTGNAATATQLAATPTLCTSGQFAQGILANGNATGCAAATATALSTNGTANQLWGMDSSGTTQGWQTPSTGSGTVSPNNGNAGAVATYAAAGGSTTVSPGANLTYVSNALTIGDTAANTDLIVQNTTAATSGTSQNSPLFALNGQYWTTSASATDQWTMQDVIGPGGNGATTLQFQHSGSTGAASIQLNSSGARWAVNTAGRFTTYNGETTVGIGAPYIKGETLAKSETGADANLLTVVITGGSIYRTSIVLSVSAATSATLGWTATWTDSNGTAQAPTNLALTPAGGTSSLTVTPTAGSTYYAATIMDCTSSNLVIKTTFSGTSIAYKATVIVEKLN